MSKKLATETKNRERGRPREFDIEQALDKAMIVFRQKGFHAASLSDLGEAMGLTAGSIYKAFKDKRSLFLLVFERYLSVRNADLRQRLAQFTTGREKLTELLQFYLDSARAVEGRTGCLVVGSTVELQVLDEDLSQLVSEAVIRNKNFLASLLKLGQEDGSVTQHLDIDSAAGLILCIAFGMRVVGKITDVKDEPATIKLVMKLLD
ncbi:TetR/AcrR family transcriptional regulator [Pantoea sp. BIGb0393]|uniref:TetR/AcrR family transcriptional regulator n=1 Tax=Pantoea nemavictus TaxID=2726955 RepID=A0ABU8PNY2_9GAMM|nr:MULTISPECIES: TetR/AcrR family transcriptional regulator [Pantoea]KNC11460.1 transcriptional regulator [Pantoea sp. RIT-PI-b]MBA0034859.1 TetR/AcrR family transcriptional regulator [Pantoea nemavictus]